MSADRAASSPFAAHVDGAEAALLLAELAHFRAELGADAVSRIIGRPYDRAFIGECIEASITRRRVRGHLYTSRVRPTPTLERALDALWQTVLPD